MQIQNQYLEFSADKMQVTEELDAQKNKWLNINGVALVAGKSRNNRIWTDENLKENDGQEFKYIVNHPKQGENIKSEQVVGKGTLRYVDGILRHEGRIRDTTTHPDIMSRVSDGLLDPSIGANFKKIDTVMEGGEKVIRLSGTEITNVALIAYPGVKSASIEVAAEESFNAHNSIIEEKDPENEIKNNGDKVMEEDNKYKQLYEELAAKTAKEEAEAKNQIIEDLKKRVQVLEEGPSEESKPEEKKEEESKEEEKPKDEPEAKESGVGQIVTEEAETKNNIKEDKDGVTMATEAYTQFNNEIRENVGQPQN